jgi:membrane protease YdiL (CAAX protease family)
VGVFLSATFAASWLLWGLAHPVTQRLVGALPPPGFLVMLGTAAPGIAALMMAAAQGSAGRLLSALAAWRVHPGWFALAFLGPPAIMLLANACHVVLGGAAPSYPAWGRWPLVLVNFGGVLLLGGPLGEEPGWRGLALPRLEERFGPLVSTLILTPLWALWHLPMFFYRPGYQGGLPIVIGFLFGLLAGAIVLTFLYDGTCGSILIVVVFHILINVAMQVATVVSQPVVVAMNVLTAVAAVAIAVHWIMRATTAQTRLRGATAPNDSGLPSGARAR